MDSLKNREEEEEIKITYSWEVADEEDRKLKNYRGIGLNMCT